MTKGVSLAQPFRGAKGIHSEPQCTYPSQSLPESMSSTTCGPHPCWFLRQAGRYQSWYMEIRKHHSLLEICRSPELAAEVTITAAEQLGVDAAIIFSDLLLPLTPMGLKFDFASGEGPVVAAATRSASQIVHCGRTEPRNWAMSPVRLRRSPRTSSLHGLTVTAYRKPLKTARREYSRCGASSRHS